jgi:aminopeptidase N
LPLLLLIAGAAHADSYIRQPAIDVVHYELALELSDRSDVVSGSARIQIMIQAGGVSNLWLDFSDMTVDSLSVDGQASPYTHVNGHLNLALGREYGRHEIADIAVRYHGQPGKAGGLLIRKNKYGRRVFFVENWPDRAHHWFPCIDHPSDKATFGISLTAPANYEVIANGRLIETRSLLDGRKVTRWSESKPIPAYCMVFGAAEFSFLTDGTAAGAPLYIYSYPQDSEAAARKFARSGLALTYFSELIGPYPYEKLAQVESTTENSGMENASAIFYAEQQFQNEPVGENPVPHEIAHQWFGDSVTEADWDHLWISEGFATYFEALFYEHLRGPEALRPIMAKAAEAIKKFHQGHPSPLIDPGLADPRLKLNAFSYQKGAWVLHMLRNMLGDEVFFDGIRRFYSLYEGRNAVTEDFQKVMEAVSGTSLSGFFRQWLYQPGWPDYRVSWRWDEGTMEITIRQAQTSGLFDMPLEVGIRGGERRVVQIFRVSAETQTFRFPLQFRPVAVEIDPGDRLLKSVAVTGPE